MSEDVTNEQHAVQQKMGRCLLLLQQYERLLKWLAARQAIEGSGDKLQAIGAQRVEKLKNKTLGHLVDVLTESYLSLDSLDGTNSASDDPQGEVRDSGWFRMRSSIVMSPERYAQTVQELHDLVTLRNDLVHHLIDKFDVSTLDGCRDATVYLDAAYLRIDSSYAALTAWDKSMQETHALMASFFASEAWEESFVHGNAPGEAVDWPRAKVVELLRDAAKTMAQDGWTKLADAIAFIAAVHAEHTPRRYGCSSWRQVLHESKQFTLRRERVMGATSGTTWYRSDP